MEYVEGESLHDLLAREKKLDPERGLDLISAICAGVGPHIIRVSFTATSSR